MKTAVIMNRDLSGMAVRQNSKTQFFNANDLIELYNSAHGDDKKIHHYLANDSTKRFIDALMADSNTRNSGDLENGTMETKRGKNGGTWMHPYLFIDFAMWLSPEFKVSVIRWVYDNVIKLRNECGDKFKDVNEALFELKPNSAPFTYSNEANMINKLVFGTVDKGQRNLASEKQLELLKQMQRLDVGLIKSGKDYYERYEELKKYTMLLDN